MNDDLVVNERVQIPRSELVMRATRSGGPGGQHVNTSSTRIEVTWNLDHSAALDDTSRARVRTFLGGRVDSGGNVRVVASDSRSQRQNRELAEDRLVALIRRALIIPKTRRKTRPTASSVAARLDDKRRRSRLKGERRRKED